MIVSLIALFIAMGGTTYAVTSPPKRSVGSLQLKKGAVHKENLANGAVTITKLGKGLVAVSAGPAGPAGPTAPLIVNQDIPSDGVSYAAKAGWADNAGKADRATLADRATSAASATSAGSASSAGSATTAGSAGNANKLGGQDSSYYLPRSTIVDLPRFSLGNGQTRVLLTSGPLKYTGRCDIGSGGLDSADILISTTENHAAFDGDAINPDLLTSSPEGSRLYAHVEAPAGQPIFKAEDDGTSVAAGGEEVGSTVWYVGVNLFNTTGRCYFGGFAML
jgi:hypothetical protein